MASASSQARVCDELKKKKKVFLHWNSPIPGIDINTNTVDKFKEECWGAGE